MTSHIPARDISPCPSCLIIRTDTQTHISTYQQASSKLHDVTPVKSTGHRTSPESCHAKADKENIAAFASQSVEVGFGAESASSGQRTAQEAAPCSSLHLAAVCPADVSRTGAVARM